MQEESKTDKKFKVAILGGGIAGLSSGWILKERGIDFKVFERQSYYGGMARSFDWHGFKCDIACHRFFTNNKLVLQQINSLVPLEKKTRQSQIYIGGKRIKDPVSPIELVLRFFPKPGLNFVLEYLFRKKGNDQDEQCFENYALQRYGKGLNGFFFKPYTEKLFGISADQVSIEWARQKIRVSGLIDTIKKNTKLYFSYFYYPKAGGYGAFADKFYQDISERVLLATEVKEIHTYNNKIKALTYLKGNEQITEEFDAVISTLPITVLGRMLGTNPKLRFRPVRIVYLLINKPSVSSNQWTYFAQKDIIVNRLGEFKNFTATSAPKNKTVLCCEVTMDYDDDKLTEKVIDDLTKAKFLSREDISDSILLRETFGYPIYDLGSSQEAAKAKAFMASFSNLYLLGRSAEFTHKEVDDIFLSAIELADKMQKQTSRSD